MLRRSRRQRRSAEAAKILAERKIGALVVTGAGGRIIGIVSERDMVRAFAQHGVAALATAADRCDDTQGGDLQLERLGLDADGA